MASVGHDPFDPEVMKELKKDITHEEVSQLTRAMKRPEFKEHFQEYIDEISDPKNKKEYEQYLKQLEDAGEMPKGKVLLRCKPGICVKTSIRFQSGQVQKLFLNICHTDKLGDVQFKKQEVKAHENPEAAGRTPGYAVSLPYSASPPRPDKDKKDHLCMVSDVAVSERTFVQAVQNEALLKLVVDTVCEAITASCLKGGETVSRDFKVAMLFRMAMRRELGVEGMTPAELRKMQKRAKREREEGKANDDEQQSVASPVTDENQEADENNIFGSSAEADASSGLILQPKFKIVEVGQLRDLSSFVDSSAENIRLEVELPGVKHSNEIDVDTAGVAGGVIVQTKRPKAFALELSTIVRIRTYDEMTVGDNAVARFDKRLHRLSVTYPVTGRKVRESAEGMDAALPVVDDTAKLKSADAGAAVEEPETEVGYAGDEVDDDRVLAATDVADSSDQCSGGDPENISSSTESAVEGSEKSSSVVELGFETISQRSQDIEEDDGDFMASDTFEGPRVGYYFGMGNEGLGYYKDSEAACTKQKSETLEDEGAGLYGDGQGCEPLEGSVISEARARAPEPLVIAESTSVPVENSEKAESRDEADSSQQAEDNGVDPAAALLGQSVRLESSLPWILL
ncbi:PIH1 domain containing [Perkinsus olseni]|uniref:PIH1 domain containing n=1 Tax=Perkinsus olseni TaxID=32597 RepID=A0A7J6PJ57_PEROL|nr:PIH1 domain containing [Perkinsus olseni]